MRLRLFAFLLTASATVGQTFEVASVKPALSSRGINVLISPSGRLTATNCTLELLIQQAYNLDRYQISGGPAWLASDRYDIVATPPSSAPPPSRQDQRIMLQNLLTERFQLKVRRESKEGTVYALVVLQKLKVQPTKNPEDRPLFSNGFNGDHDSPDVGYYIEGRNVSMPLFAAKLSGFVNRPVYDETGLSGGFDFKFDYAEGNDTDFLFAAIRSALGLKLEARKGAIETLVIEHAEKPGAN